MTRAVAQRPVDSRKRTDSARRLVVAVHDVAPAFSTEVHALLRALDALDVSARVLLVVPRSPAWGALRDAPALVDLLRREVAAGSEIVLHGYTHEAVGALRGPRTERVRARLFARDAAELLTLDEPEIARRLLAGWQELEDLGLPPQGFCAPAWLATLRTIEMLPGLGFRYYLGMSCLHDLASGRRRRMPWAGYMGAGPRQERLIRAAGAVQLLAGRFAPVVNVFFHPAGVPESVDYRRALGALARVRRGREVVTYGACLDG